jgi:hypothetical protein
MHIRRLLGITAMSAGSMLFSMPAAAACTESFNLGSMGPPSAVSLYNDFGSQQQFSDCYNFTLNNSADAFGLTLEWDWSAARDIDVTSVSLTGGGLAGTVTDDSPLQFSFSNLLAGAYQLIVSGSVTATDFSRYGDGKVGYIGVLATNGSIAAPVPEPETYAMLALGLAIVGFAARKRRGTGPDVQSAQA